MWILTVSKDSRLVAYAILNKENNALDIRRLRLVDFQALHGFENTINRLLFQAIDKSRSEGIHLLEVTGCWLDRPGLPRIIVPHIGDWLLGPLCYKAESEDHPTYCEAKCLAALLFWGNAQCSGLYGDQ